MILRRSTRYDASIRSSEITPESAFREHSESRRRFVTGAASVGAVTAGATIFARNVPGLLHPSVVEASDTALGTVPSAYTVPDQQTPAAKAVSYNNFYEFGTDKSDPARNAHTLQTRPWTVEIKGLVKQPRTVSIDDLLHFQAIENRVYRHRCVEAWSMVIPWDGYSLSKFINFCQPLSSAKYIQFISLLDKKQMPRLPYGYDWPYSEGLRLDEAMNPLCLLTFGCYGNILPNQNGAPVRVVTPWKYGFKNAKSIVTVNFTDKQPRTLWNEIAPGEYGFYSNVNPTVDHPRWSQAHERRIDASAFPHTIPTQMFNGYGDQVASLYSGMDLKKNY